MNNKWSLTTMFINGHEKYPMLIADGLPYGIKPWLFDIRFLLTSLTICETI